MHYLKYEFVANVEFIFSKMNKCVLSQRQKILQVTLQPRKTNNPHNLKTSRN